ncbi:MAG: endonuclease V [Propionibacteriaceae bacterium]|nr:endonuclease V [Propionibacteriaceae bacterium]
MSEGDGVECTAPVGAVDVHYDEHGAARAALVVGDDPSFSTLLFEHVADILDVAPYEPGALYKRELPCIRTARELASRLGFLIVDGYATLDPQGRPGLGLHAAQALGIPVIGVAKTPFPHGHPCCAGAPGQRHSTPVCHSGGRDQ